MPYLLHLLKWLKWYDCCLAVFEINSETPYQSVQLSTNAITVFKVTAQVFCF